MSTWSSATWNNKHWGFYHKSVSPKQNKGQPSAPRASWNHYWTGGVRSWECHRSANETWQFWGLRGGVVKSKSVASQTYLQGEELPASALQQEVGTVMTQRVSDWRSCTSVRRRPPTSRTSGRMLCVAASQSAASTHIGGSNWTLQ